MVYTDRMTQLAAGCCRAASSRKAATPWRTTTRSRSSAGVWTNLAPDVTGILLASPLHSILKNLLKWRGVQQHDGLVNGTGVNGTQKYWVVRNSWGERSFRGESCHWLCTFTERRGLGLPCDLCSSERLNAIQQHAACLGRVLPLTVHFYGVRLPHDCSMHAAACSETCSLA